MGPCRTDAVARTLKPFTGMRKEENVRPLAPQPVHGARLGQRGHHGAL